MGEFHKALAQWLDEEYRRLSEHNCPGGYARGVRGGRLQAYAELACICRTESLPRHTPEKFGRGGDG